MFLLLSELFKITNNNNNNNNNDLPSEKRKIIFFTKLFNNLEFIKFFAINNN